MSGGRCRLVACGIFSKEIHWLIEKNRWPVDPVFLDSSMHTDLAKLSKGLTSTLIRFAEADVAVFYGACHPCIDQILAEAGTFRTPVENCVEALLGREVYLRELENGAFFLFEDWARRARPVILDIFDGNEAVARDVYQTDRKYLLCIRTPRSGDFTSEAEETGRLVGLPLRWMDASLDHLETVLGTAIKSKGEVAS
ncbi:MAG: DUF1638 domain-containing protein [Thermoanaerobaculia bacterium]